MLNNNQISIPSSNKNAQSKRIFFPELSLTTTNQTPKALPLSLENISTMDDLLPLTTKSSVFDQNTNQTWFSKFPVTSSSKIMSTTNKSNLLDHGVKSPINFSQRTTAFSVKGAQDKSFLLARNSTTNILPQSIPKARIQIKPKIMLSETVNVQNPPFHRSVSTRNTSLERSKRLEEHINQQNKFRLKNEILKKVLCQATMGNIKPKDQNIVSSSNNSVLNQKEILKIKTKINEQRADKIQNKENGNIELEGHKKDNIEGAANSNQGLYKSIRLKYLFEPTPEVSVKENLNIKIRPFIMENLDTKSIKYQTIFVSNAFKSQKNLIKKTVIREQFAVKALDSNKIKENREELERKEKKERLERSSSRCLEKEQKLVSFVEEMKIANDTMSREMSLIKTKRSTSTIANN